MFQHLPAELQETVVCSLDSEGLKSLRLVGRMGAIATPRLFNTLHLSPSRNSYARAKQVQEHPVLSTHVRRLVYHQDIVNVAYAAKVEHFKLALMRGPCIDGRCQESDRDWLLQPTATEKQLAELYEKYTEGRIAELFHNYRTLVDDNLDDPNVQAFEEKTFPEIVQRIRLESFECVDGTKFPLPFRTDGPESFLAKRTGLGEEYQVQSACTVWRSVMFLKAVSLSKLHSVRLLRLSWLAFAEPGVLPRLLNSFTPSLREFHYRPWYCHGLLGAQEEALSWMAYRRLLSMTAEATVIHLTLRLRDFAKAFDEHETLGKATDIVFQQFWPHLRYLELDGIITSEDKLLQWLVRHCKTLRTLHLTHIELKGATYNLESPFRIRPSCGPSLFFSMASKLNLENASLYSYLAVLNVDGMAEWSYGFDFSPLPRLEPDVCKPWEDYVCHRGPWPLPMPLDDYLAIMKQKHRDEWQALETQYQLQQ